MPQTPLIYSFSQLYAHNARTDDAWFLERLLPLLVHMLVTGALLYPPLTSKNLIPTTSELGQPMRVKG